MTHYAEKISDIKYATGTEYERTSKQYMRKLVPQGTPLKVLDVGCGTGLNARVLATKGHEVVGIDISEKAIEKFRQAGFVGEKCDIAKEIPFKDCSFDLVYASETIEHVVDTKRFLAEIYRVLKPGGMLLLSAPNSAFWVYRLLSVFGRTLSEVQHTGHVRFFSKSSLRVNLEGVGFSHLNICARHMYVLLGDGIAQHFTGLLRTLGFKREFRFRTKVYFWHLSHFARRGSSFWADTLIVTATKPGAETAMKMTRR